MAIHLSIALFCARRKFNRSGPSGAFLVTIEIVDERRFIAPDVGGDDIGKALERALLLLPTFLDASLIPASLFHGLFPCRGHVIVMRRSCFRLASARHSAVSFHVVSLLEIIAKRTAPYHVPKMGTSIFFPREILGSVP